ncbi:phasin [Salipiger sp.]|uniref:phasin n=1 Tax=Salipiger sp. TaxID=2078585 RepID=UPI003A980730
MATSQDFTAMMKDMFGAFPTIDTSAMDEAFKSSTTLAEKMSGIGIDAATRSTDISTAWTMETLAGLSDLSKAKAEPQDYAKILTDFATSQAERASEHMAAYAEVAKTAQMETVELFMSAGKGFADDMTAATRTMAKATETAAAEAATTTAKAATTATRKATTATRKAATTTRKTAAATKAVVEEAVKEAPAPTPAPKPTPAPAPAPAPAAAAPSAPVEPAPAVDQTAPETPNTTSES